MPHPAPVTESEDLEGGRLRLSDYRGKVVVLVFWGACGGCRADVPRLRELLDRFKDQTFAVLGVYCDDDVAKVLQAYAHANPNSRVALDAFPAEHIILLRNTWAKCLCHKEERKAGFNVSPVKWQEVSSCISHQRRSSLQSK